MTSEIDERKIRVFERAREIVLRDDRISPDDKEAVVKLIAALIQASETTPPASRPADKPARTLTQDFISKYSLIKLVRHQADELDSLKRLSLKLTSSLDLQTVLDAVVAEAMRLVGNSRSAHIFLYTDGKLEFGAALTSEGVKNQPMWTPRPNGLTATVARQTKRIVVEDMSSHPLYAGQGGSETKGSIIGLPLTVDKQVVGIMNLSRSSVGGFNGAELRLLELLADQAAVAISNASLHQIVTQQAYSDTLTDLPNRRALDERLDVEVRYASRTNTAFAVIMMDLDGFKSVNDTYGHAIGDEVLRSVFGHLADSMRATDFLARYGGDELTLILRQSDVPEARLVSEKILEKIRAYRYRTADGRSISLGVSGGIAIYPLHARNGAELLRAADAALYHAKKHQRGTFAIARSATGPLTPPAQTAPPGDD